MRQRPFVLLLLAGLPAACADGGDEDRPQSEVRFTNQNHLFGFKSLRGFGAFPVQPSVAFSDRGSFNLFDDSSYTVERSSGTSSAQDYALAADGKLSVYLLGGGNEPSTVFFGAYGRVGASDLREPGDTPDFFFTDRVSTPNSQAIGVFFGTEKVDAALDLRGGWHAFSLHTIFGATLSAPDNVGRAMHGNVDFTGATADIALGIAGTGFQSDSSGQPAAGLNLGGSIQFLLDGATGDGRCNLTLQYDADSRVMRAATSNNLVYMLDEDETDGEAGFGFLVREFDTSTPTTSLDEDDVDGAFYVGGHTLFVNPSNMGSDTFIGTVTLSTNGAFRLDAVGNQGVDFAYSGEWTAAADGKLTITISGTGETWHGAIDRTYNTLVLVDDFVETRSNNLPELNLMLGIRKKVD
jgi:hypothetical protein